MHCTHCSAEIPLGVDSCPSCRHPVDMDHVAIDALTPPDDGRSVETAEMIDELTRRLQGALGGKYRVESPLGAGGFAVVFLVQDLTLKRSLAVKVLSPELVSSATVLKRFRHEAETVAQLSHPHIVPIHFIGESGDLFYLAMAFVDGESLAERIKRSGSLAIEDAARILYEVASALELAHRRGVVHRDIKPHNVLLERESGRALLTDFGIARTVEGGSLTMTGMLVGTPAYMAPEQVTGQPIDHRIDIYALGTVAYEILVGIGPRVPRVPEGEDGWASPGPQTGRREESPSAGE